MLNNIVDLRPFLQRKTSAVKCYNAAWTLHSKYADIAQENTRLAQIFALAGDFVEYQAAKDRARYANDMAALLFDIANAAGDTIEDMGGAL